METIRGYIYRLYPTREQSALMAQTAGVVRLVYNLALEQRQIWGGKPYGGGPSRNFAYQGLSGDLSRLRKDFDFIGAVSQTAQIQALMDLDKAFKNFYEKRAKYPSKRKKFRNDSFRYVGREVQVRRLNRTWSEVKLPKLGWIRYRDSRPLPLNAAGKVEIRNATVSLSAGVWSISISTKCEIATRSVPEHAAGIDRGVSIPYALSTGEMIYLPAGAEKIEAAARRAQKDMSRRKRGSKRYAKARARLAKLKAKQARRRAHVAHVLSRRLSRSFGMVAIEDLKIRNMTRSAAGSLEAPGRNVAQKAGLNRAILNVGWFGFEQKLAYKLEETGGVLVKVPAHYTSQTCANCGHVDAESRESQATFRCTACGEGANADINAARNILARAMSIEERRGNTPLLDVEGKALAPDEASTYPVLTRLDA